MTYRLIPRTVLPRTTRALAGALWLLVCCLVFGPGAVSSHAQVPGGWEIGDSAYPQLYRVHFACGYRPHPLGMIQVSGKFPAAAAQGSFDIHLYADGNGGEDVFLGNLASFDSATIERFTQDAYRFHIFDSAIRINAASGRLVFAPGKRLSFFAVVVSENGARFHIPAAPFTRDELIVDCDPDAETLADYFSDPGEIRGAGFVCDPESGQAMLEVHAVFRDRFVDPVGKAEVPYMVHLYRNNPFAFGGMAFYLMNSVTSELLDAYSDEEGMHVVFRESLRRINNRAPDEARMRPGDAIDLHGYVLHHNAWEGGFNGRSELPVADGVSLVVPARCQ